ncbi:glycosyltransferase family 4 protein [Sporolactobacillus terrae]|uniref:glycosyltransferase family 4 protein n=1 Tax=Sporolactobacillus terrae TaxID=269673 RepID=UPI001CC0D92C|nr:glycosyltransferase family 4 protein [Sporolactobacillus terrae]UAK16376.1 glycosyltransferase family 4 protein [Sporolactobacillus terrae]
MNVLMIHNTLPKYRVNFFNELAKHCDLTMIFHDYNQNSSIYEDVDRREELENLESYFEYNNELLKRLLTEKDFDFVIIPPLDDFQALKISRYVLTLKNKYGFKIVLFWEKWVAPTEFLPLKKKIKNTIQKVATKSIVRDVDLCVASGSKAKEYFENNGVNPQRIRVAMDAVDVKYERTVDVRERFGIDTESKIILYFGRIVERKGLVLLIKAIQKAFSNDNVFFLICGDGEEREEIERIAEDTLSLPYKFVGKVVPEDKANFFSAASLFVLPSYFCEGTPEAWGLTINESILFDVPVVSTSAVGSAYDLIVPGVGKMVEQGDIEALANGMKEVIETCSSRTVQKNKKWLSSQTMAEEFVSALEEKK